jgi:POT family proton-dependent oligopeptide transporter
MAIIYLSLTHPFSLKQAVIVLTAALFTFFYWLSTKQKDQLERKHIQTYLILAVFALLFWSMYYLAPMALTIFAEHNVNMELLGFRLTPQWLGNINVVIITLGGFLLPPVFAKIRQKTAFTVPMQFAIGLLSIGIGFAFLPIGILLANTQGQSSVLWVSLFYCFQSFGELLLAPIGYSMIAQVAPVRHQGLMMGAWMLITGSTASVMSSYLSGSVIVDGNMSASATNGNYFVLFSVLFVLAILAAITLTFINERMGLIENK